jgi:hypothetical protein
MQISKKLAIVAASGLATITIAGGAFAFFTDSGTGTGTATIADSTPWLVTSGAAQGGALAPDGFQQRVDYTVKNQSTGTQNLGNVTVSVANNGATGSADDVLGFPGCKVSWFDIQQRPYAAENLANPTAAHSITLGDYRGGVSHTGSSLIQMNNGGSVNQNACGGITLPLVVTAS